MPTPEHQVKEKVKRLLREHDVWFFMPVQTGIGASALDFICCINVQGFPLLFFVETKKYQGKLTLRQEDFIATRAKHQKARTFVIDCDLDLKGLERWLIQLEQSGLMSLIPEFLPGLAVLSEPTR